MGILYIVSTPIGNLDDITYRAVKTLSSVDLILCEDTRHTGLLLQHLKIQTKLVPYYDEIEDKRIPEVIEHLNQGKNIALVSDAGTPLVSDPGFRLVRECIKRNIKVESIPGPSALLAALTSSGLPTDKFTFLGYLPEKQSTRKQMLEHVVSMNRFIDTTYIMYCAPHKLAATLQDMKEVLGDVEIVIARELTKVHEELWRGKVSEALNYFTNPKGEFVVMITLSDT